MRYLTAGTTALLAFALATPAQAQKESEILKVQQVIATMVEKDAGMKAWFDDAYGYVVFPNVGKGAVGVGAAHGNGLVYKSGDLVGKSELIQVTVGLQLGGQSFVEVIFFKDETAFNDFTRGNFEFAAQASAVALTAGASADLAYNKGVAVMTMTNAGLMYEAAIGGQKFKYQPIGG
ncbi:MAG: lipid-binding SYLF domain-containing protein [Gemmatimonadota bacterium]|nr:MAG: lipid-binding SYLF domain-containing protein [Gemmatimonadota bacterium]